MSVRSVLNRRILITGASRGIGHAIATKAAQAGARLVLAARSTGPLEALAQELSAAGTEVVAVPADVANADDRRRLLDVAFGCLGGLDVLINNAGVGSWAHFVDSTEAILRQVMEVNFFAPAELIRLAIPHLAQGEQPAVVNIASMCGRRGVPAWSEYSASKFALCGLTEALRGELARFDIDVLLVLPGLTRTEYFAHLLRNQGRMKLDLESGMAPEEVADAVLDVLRKNRTETVLGWEAKWILRAQRLFPRFVDRMMARRVRKLYEQSATG